MGKGRGQCQEAPDLLLLGPRTLLARVWGLGGPHCKARTAVRAPIPGQLTMGSPVLLSQWEGAVAAVAVVAGMVQAAVGLLQ